MASENDPHSHIENALGAASQARARQRDRNKAMLLLAAVVLVALALIVAMTKLLGASSSDQSPVASASPAAINEAPPALDCELPANQLALQCQSRALALETLKSIDLLFEQLAPMQPELWAKEQYAEGLASFEDGRGFFFESRFDEALIALNRGNQTLTAIAASADGVASDSLASAIQALDEGRAQAALEGFQRTLLIQPDNPMAITGAYRASVYEEVARLLQLGEQALVVGDFEGARSQFSAALALDGDNSIAQAQLAKVKALLREQAVAQFVRQGYARLDAGDNAAALRAFNSALKQDPKSNSAQQGKALAARRYAEQNRDRHRALAQRHASNFAWASALAEAGSALEYDAELPEMRALQARAQTILKLDAAISDLMARPMRLADATVKAHALMLIEQGRAVASPGPAFKDKLTQLALGVAAMDRARPIFVVSDGRTQISVDGAGSLGELKKVRLDLKPGRYIFRGFRQGYREVRQELMVTPDTDQLTITLVCDEPIP